VVCLDAATGRTHWTFACTEKLANRLYEGGPNSTPLVAGERLFTASKSGNLHCFEAATGKVLWQSGTQKDMSFAAPFVARFGDSQAARFIMSEAPVAVDPKTGKARRESKFGRGCRTHCPDPVVNGDLVFISPGNDGGELLRVSAKSAERVWKNKNLSTFTGTAALTGGHLHGLGLLVTVGVDSSSVLFAIWKRNASTGCRVLFIQVGTGWGALFGLAAAGGFYRAISAPPRPDLVWLAIPTLAGAAFGFLVAFLFNRAWTRLLACPGTSVFKSAPPDPTHSPS
jgi:outer membrane protein assembly factor BamB